MKWIRIDVVPVLFTDTVYEPVGIKTRSGNKGLDFPVIGIKDHDGGTAGSNGFELPVDGGFSDTLELSVNSKHQPLTRLWFHLVHDLDNAAIDVDFLSVTAVRTAQVLIIIAFQAKFTDDVTCFEVFINTLFDFIFTDFAHIPQGVDSQFLIGISSDRLDPIMTSGR